LHPAGYIWSDSDTVPYLGLTLHSYIYLNSHAVLYAYSYQYNSEHSDLHSDTYRDRNQYPDLDGYGYEHLNEYSDLHTDRDVNEYPDEDANHDGNVSFRSTIVSLPAERSNRGRGCGCR
jgi:hypothetical protein